MKTSKLKKVKNRLCCIDDLPFMNLSELRKLTFPFAKELACFSSFYSLFYFVTGHSPQYFCLIHGISFQYVQMHIEEFLLFVLTQKYDHSDFQTFVYVFKHLPL